MENRVYVVVNELGETYGLPGGFREGKERNAAFLNRRVAEGHPYFTGETALYRGRCWTVAVAG